MFLVVADSCSPDPRPPKDQKVRKVFHEMAMRDIDAAEWDQARDILNAQGSEGLGHEVLLRLDPCLSTPVHSAQPPYVASSSDSGGQRKRGRGTPSEDSAEDPRKKPRTMTDRQIVNLMFWGDWKKPELTPWSRVTAHHCYGNHPLQLRCAEDRLAFSVLGPRPPSHAESPLEWSSSCGIPAGMVDYIESNF